MKKCSFRTLKKKAHMVDKNYPLIQMKIFNLIIWVYTQKKIKSRHHAMRQRLNMRLRGLNDIKYVVLRAVASTV